MAKEQHYAALHFNPTIRVYSPYYSRESLKNLRLTNLTYDEIEELAKKGKIKLKSGYDSKPIYYNQNKRKAEKYYRKQEQKNRTAKNSDILRKKLLKDVPTELWICPCCRKPLMKKIEHHEILISKCLFCNQYFYPFITMEQLNSGVKISKKLMVLKKEKTKRKYTEGFPASSEMFRCDVCKSKYLNIDTGLYYCPICAQYAVLEKSKYQIQSLDSNNNKYEIPLIIINLDEEMRKEKIKQEQQQKKPQKKLDESIKCVQSSSVWFCPVHDIQLDLTAAVFYSSKVVLGYCKECGYYYCLPETGCEGNAYKGKRIRYEPKIKFL